MTSETPVEDLDVLAVAQDGELTRAAAVHEVCQETRGPPKR